MKPHMNVGRLQSSCQSCDKLRLNTKIPRSRYVEVRKWNSLNPSTRARMLYSVRVISPSFRLVLSGIVKGLRLS